MAIRVIIRDEDIIRALNTPGGPVREWVDDVSANVMLIAEATAPINSILNALHRGGAVGEFQRSFSFDRRGSSGHRVLGRVLNDSDHAEYAELGRSASFDKQVFTWERWLPNVGPRRVNATNARDGSHTLGNAFRMVLGGSLGGGVLRG